MALHRMEDNIHTAEPKKLGQAQLDDVSLTREAYPPYKRDNFIQ